MFSLKLCEVFQIIFDIEHLITTASKFLTRSKEFQFVNVLMNKLGEKNKNESEKNIYILIEFWNLFCGVFKTNWCWVVIW